MRSKMGTGKPMLPRAIRDLLHTKVCNARAGYGSFLDIFLNSPSLGEVRVWIYQCDWIITNGINRIDSQRFDREAIQRTFLNRELLEIGVAEGRNKLHLKFSEGVMLTLVANAALYGDDDLIIFYLQKGHTISFRESAGFYEEREI